jgi:hypothetical protein
MNFERNAVESDYDDEYDQKTVYMQQGKAVIVRDEEEQIPHTMQDMDSYEYRGGYSETKAQQPTSRPRRGVQLPIDRPTEEVVEMEVDEKPLLNLPKGGWVVSKMNVAPITPFFEVMATLSDKAPSGEVNARPVSAPRGWIPRVSKWKSIPNDALFASNGLSDPEPPVSMPSAKPMGKPVAKFSPHKVETPVATSVAGLDKRKNTKICRFVDIKIVGGKTIETNKCRAGGTCTYAHSIALWTPLCCRFQDNCRNFATCVFKHTQETKESYNDRIKKLGQ